MQSAHILHIHTMHILHNTIHTLHVHNTLYSHYTHTTPMAGPTYFGVLNQARVNGAGEGLGTRRTRALRRHHRSRPMSLPKAHPEEPVLTRKDSGSGPVLNPGFSGCQTGLTPTSSLRLPGDPSVHLEWTWHIVIASDLSPSVQSFSLEFGPFVIFS